MLKRSYFSKLSSGLLKPFSFLYYTLLVTVFLNAPFRLGYFFRYIINVELKLTWYLLSTRFWADDLLFAYNLVQTGLFFLSLLKKLLSIYLTQIRRSFRVFNYYIFGRFLRISWVETYYAWCFQLTSGYFLILAFFIGLCEDIWNKIKSYRIYISHFIYWYTGVQLLFWPTLVLQLKVTLDTLKAIRDVRILFCSKKTRFFFADCVFIGSSMKRFCLSMVTIRLHDINISEFVEIGYPISWFQPTRLLQGVYTTDSYFVWSLASEASEYLIKGMEKYGLAQMPKYLIPANTHKPSVHVTEVASWIKNNIDGNPELFKEFFELFYEHFKFVLLDELHKDPYALIRLKLVTPFLNKPSKHPVLSEYLFDSYLIEQICEYWQFVTITTGEVALVSKTMDMEQLRNHLSNRPLPSSYYYSYYDDLYFLLLTSTEIWVLQFYLYAPPLLLSHLQEFDTPHTYWFSRFVTSPYFNDPWDMALDQDHWFAFVIVLSVVGAWAAHFCFLEEPIIVPKDFINVKSQYLWSTKGEKRSFFKKQWEFLTGLKRVFAVEEKEESIESKLREKEVEEYILFEESEELKFQAAVAAEEKCEALEQAREKLLKKKKYRNKSWNRTWLLLMFKVEDWWVLCLNTIKKYFFIVLAFIRQRFTKLVDFLKAFVTRIRDKYERKYRIEEKIHVLEPYEKSNALFETEPLVRIERVSPLWRLAKRVMHVWWDDEVYYMILTIFGLSLGTFYHLIPLLPYQAALTPYYRWRWRRHARRSRILADIYFSRHVKEVRRNRFSYSYDANTGQLGRLFDFSKPTALSYFLDGPASVESKFIQPIFPLSEMMHLTEKYKKQVKASVTQESPLFDDIRRTYVKLLLRRYGKNRIAAGLGYLEQDMILVYQHNWSHHRFFTFNFSGHYPLLNPPADPNNPSTLLHQYVKYLQQYSVLDEDIKKDVPATKRESKRSANQRDMAQRLNKIKQPFMFITGYWSRRERRALSSVFLRVNKDRTDLVQPRLKALASGYSKALNKFLRNEHYDYFVSSTYGSTNRRLGKVTLQNEIILQQLQAACRERETTIKRLSDTVLQYPPVVNTTSMWQYKTPTTKPSGDSNIILGSLWDSLRRGFEYDQIKKFNEAHVDYLARLNHYLDFDFAETFSYSYSKQSKRKFKIFDLKPWLDVIHMNTMVKTLDKSFRRTSFGTDFTTHGGYFYHTVKDRHEFMVMPKIVDITRSGKSIEDNVSLPKKILHPFKEGIVEKVDLVRIFNQLNISNEQEKQQFVKHLTVITELLDYVRDFVYTEDKRAEYKSQFPKLVSFKKKFSDKYKLSKFKLRQLKKNIFDKGQPIDFKPILRKRGQRNHKQYYDGFFKDLADILATSQLNNIDLVKKFRELVPLQNSLYTFNLFRGFRQLFVYDNKQKTQFLNLLKVIHDQLSLFEEFSQSDYNKEKFKNEFIPIFKELDSYLTTGLFTYNSQSFLAQLKEKISFVYFRDFLVRAKKLTKWWWMKPRGIDNKKYWDLAAHDFVLQDPTPVVRIQKIVRTHYWRTAPSRIVRFFRWLIKTQYNGLYFLNIKRAILDLFEKIFLVPIRKKSISRGMNFFVFEDYVKPHNRLLFISNKYFEHSSRVPGVRRSGILLSAYDWVGIYDTFRYKMYGSLKDLRPDGFNSQRSYSLQKDNRKNVPLALKEDPKNARIYIGFADSTQNKYSRLLSSSVTQYEDIWNEIMFDNLPYGYNFSNTFPTAKTKKWTTRAMKTLFNLDNRFEILDLYDNEFSAIPDPLAAQGPDFLDDTIEKAVPSIANNDAEDEYVDIRETYENILIDTIHPLFSGRRSNSNILHNLRTLDVALFDTMVSTNARSVRTPALHGNNVIDMSYFINWVNAHPDFAGFKGPLRPPMGQLKNNYPLRQRISVSDPLSLMQAETQPALLNTQVGNDAYHRGLSLNLTLGAAYTRLVTDLIYRERPLSTGFWFQVKPDFHEYFSTDLDRLRYLKNKNLDFSTTLFERFHLQHGHVWRQGTIGALRIKYAKAHQRRKAWLKWKQKLASVLKKEAYWNDYLPGVMGADSSTILGKVRQVFGEEAMFDYFFKATNHWLINKRQSNPERANVYMNMMDAVLDVSDPSERLNLITGILQDKIVGVNSSVWFDFFLNDLSVYMRFLSEPDMNDYIDDHLAETNFLPGTIYSPQSLRNYLVDLTEYRNSVVDRRYFFDNICRFVKASPEERTFSPVTKRSYSRLFRQINYRKRAYPFHIYPWNSPDFKFPSDALLDCLLFNADERLFLEDIFYEYYVPPKPKVWIGDKIRRPSATITTADIDGLNYTDSILSFTKKVTGKTNYYLFNKDGIIDFFNKVVYASRSPYPPLYPYNFYPGGYVRGVRPPEHDDWLGMTAAKVANELKSTGQEHYTVLLDRRNKDKVKKRVGGVKPVIKNYAQQHKLIERMNPLVLTEDWDSIIDVRAAAKQFKHNKYRIEQMRDAFDKHFVNSKSGLYVPTHWKLRKLWRLREMYHTYLELESTRAFNYYLMWKSTADNIVSEVILPNLDNHLAEIVPYSLTKTLTHTPLIDNYKYNFPFHWCYAAKSEQRELYRQYQEEQLTFFNGLVNKVQDQLPESFSSSDWAVLTTHRLKSIEAERKLELVTPERFLPSRASQDTMEDVLHNHVKTWDFFDTQEEAVYTEELFDALDKPLLNAIAPLKNYIVDNGKIQSYIELLDKDLFAFAKEFKKRDPDYVFYDDKLQKEVVKGSLGYNTSKSKRYAFLGDEDIYRDETKFPQRGAYNRLLGSSKMKWSDLFLRQIGHKDRIEAIGLFSRRHYEIYPKSSIHHRATAYVIAQDAFKRTLFLPGYYHHYHLKAFEGHPLYLTSEQWNHEIFADQAFPDEFFDFFHRPEFFLLGGSKLPEPTLQEYKNEMILAGFYHAGQLSRTTGSFFRRTRRPKQLQELVLNTSITTPISTYGSYSALHAGASFVDWADIYDPTTQQLRTSMRSQSPLKQGGLFLQRYYGYTRPTTFDERLRHASSLINNIDSIITGYTRYESLVGVEYAVSHFLNHYFGVVPYKIVEALLYGSYWGYNLLQAIYHGSFIDCHIQQMMTHRPTEGLLDLSGDFQRSDFMRRSVYKPFKEVQIERYEMEANFNNFLSFQERLEPYRVRDTGIHSHQFIEHFHNHFFNIIPYGNLDGLDYLLEQWSEERKRKLKYFSYRHF